MENIEVKKKVILATIYNKEIKNIDYQISELANLAIASGYEVLGVVTQTKDKKAAATYFGTGKLFELKETVSELKADIVIFNDELSPSTLNNISSVVDNARIIDRTMLILDIFAIRAKTKEAKLQVELANLKYMLPRLVGMHENMSRQAGGSGASSSRGAGEKALELDRRHIEKRIYKIEQELNDVIKDRYTTRNLRKKNEVKTVAVVGYTNAGKSTTINNILKHSVNYEEEKTVFEKDMLFATLDTETRRVKFEDNHEFLITDTVGFVERLPHNLIESFKSTLEEVTEADLILHVLDASSPNVLIQLETTLNVLKELNCTNIPTIYVLNKIDLCNNILFLNDYVPEDSIHISNKNNTGIDELISTIKNNLFDEEVYCKMLIPYTKGNIVSNLLENALVHSTEYLDNGTKLSVTLNKKLYSLYQQYIIEE